MMSRCSAVEILGIQLVPAILILIKARPTRRENRKISETRASRQMRQHLGFETLLPGGTGDHRHANDVEQGGEKPGHLVVDGRLTRCERSVEIEDDQRFHLLR